MARAASSGEIFEVSTFMAYAFVRRMPKLFPRHTFAPIRAVSFALFKNRERAPDPDNKNRSRRERAQAGSELFLIAQHKI